jgi:hypothetical protein
MYFSLSRTECTRASAHLRARAWLRIHLSMDGFSSNSRWTYYKSHQVAWATYFSYSRTARTQAQAWLNIRLFLNGFSENFLGSLRNTISGKDYVLFIFTHLVHECGLAWARARVIKRSLIYGRILFKFAVNILQITSSSMGYVLVMFTHRAHACERVCASTRG